MATELPVTNSLILTTDALAESVEGGGWGVQISVLVKTLTCEYDMCHYLA